MRRTDICLYLGPADRAELEALRTDRNTARKLAWRAGIVLETADGAEAAAHETDGHVEADGLALAGTVSR